MRLPAIVVAAHRGEQSTPAHDCGLAPSQVTMSACDRSPDALTGLQHAIVKIEFVHIAAFSGFVPVCTLHVSEPFSTLLSNRLQF